MILKSDRGSLPTILYNSQPNTVSFTWNGSSFFRNESQFTVVW